MRNTGLKLAAATLLLAMATPALAATCQNTNTFERWLDEFKKDAVAKGISPQVVAAAGPDFVVDPAVIKRDRSQAVFSQSFLQFSDRMVSAPRLKIGAAQVLAAFWGLESDFGAVTGNFRLIRSLATLAYDCRRSDFFRGELLDALRIMQRGDQSAEDMTGDWAGEFGGMQVTASDYLKNGIDYDGD